MPTWIEQIESTIRTRHLFRVGDRILIAVSGGLDSMVLLHVLRRLSAHGRWRLAIAHFNHQLRGEESDADERFVQATARRMGIECFVGRANVRRHQVRHKLSLEMAARELRHRFLAATAVASNHPAVALAHQANDQVELFFLRLLRGTGSGGLAGMKWSGSSAWNPAVRLVRPLLDQPKSVLQTYAAEEGVGFRHDSSNTDPDFQRNRVRGELLPLLAAYYQPALLETTLRVMNILGAEAEFVAATARRWLARKSRRQLSLLPLAVQRQVVQGQLIQLGVEPAFELVEHLRRKPGQAVMVSPNVVLICDSAGRISQRQTPRWRGEDRPAKAGRRRNRAPGVSASMVNRIELRLAAGEVKLNGLHVQWRRSRHRRSRMPRWRSGCEFFDADRVGALVRLRYWRAGDRFQPSGFASPAKLQDLFTNLKVPRAQRHRLVIGETASGEIFWVEGLRIAERFKLDNQTIRCLKWTWKRE